MLLSTWGPPQFRLVLIMRNSRRRAQGLHPRREPFSGLNGECRASWMKPGDNFSERFNKTVTNGRPSLGSCQLLLNCCSRLWRQEIVVTAAPATITKIGGLRSPDSLRVPSGQRPKIEHPSEQEVLLPKEPPQCEVESWVSPSSERSGMDRLRLSSLTHGSRLRDLVAFKWSWSTFIQPPSPSDRRRTS